LNRLRDGGGPAKMFMGGSEGVPCEIEAAHLPRGSGYRVTVGGLHRFGTAQSGRGVCRVVGRLMAWEIIRLAAKGVCDVCYMGLMRPRRFHGLDCPRRQR
jgi:hypothetical protein